MDPRLVQRTRYVLQARVRRAKSCPAPLFPAACLHLLDWVEHHPILAAVVAELRRSGTQFDEAITAAEAYAAQRRREPTPVVAESLLAHTGLCLRVVESIANRIRRDLEHPEKKDEDAKDLGID